MILLADRRDKKPLDERHGPLQIIVPGEKRHGAGFARSSHSRSVTANSVAVESAGGFAQGSGTRRERQTHDHDLSIITSVDLMTALTESPAFSPISSADPRVMAATISTPPTVITTSAITLPSFTDLIVAGSWLRR